RKKVPTRAWSCAIPCFICRSPLRSPGIRTPVPR
ncbi:vgrE protein, partial [Escherichia coli PA34]